MQNDSQIQTDRPIEPISLELVKDMKVLNTLMAYDNYVMNCKLKGVLLVDILDATNWFEQIYKKQG